MILTRKTVRFILQSTLSKKLISWSKDITFPEEIIFATLARIDRKKYFESGIITQNNAKRSRTYPICPRKTLWNYALDHCYGQRHFIL